MLLSKKSYYVGPSGSFTSNLETDTIKYVLENMSGD